MSDPYGYNQPIERPKTLTYAVYGMWLGGLLTIVSTAFLFTMDTAEMKSLMVTEMEKQPTYDPSVFDAREMVDVIVPIIQIGGAVFGVITLGVWIWMAVMNGRGRNWARITATVLGALSLAASLSSVGNIAGNAALGGATMPMSAGNVVLAVLDPLLVIAIVVLLWLRPSSAYFSAVGAARQRQRQGQHPDYYTG
ncbi:hypothetical protein NBCG_00060 [Nocardioidaceae bacterium Broad-1]|nr:hypothetical protein NBCG_00060 [Nocardioidaceae bacterium Broad-1]